MYELKVKTNSRNQMIDITDDVQEIINTQKVESGYLIVYVPHTTAAVTINEGADPNVQHDIIKKLETLIPKNEGYQHMEGNSDAHIKASLIGPSETIIVDKGRLVLGTWQHIFFYEGDGPISRRVFVEIFEK